MIASRSDYRRDSPSRQRPFPRASPLGPANPERPTVPGPSAAYPLVPEIPHVDPGQFTNLERQLRTTQAEISMSHERRLRSGRFDPRSMVRSERDPDDPRLFRSSTRIPTVGARLSVVICLDVSWSARQSWSRATVAAGSIAQALRRCGSRCAIVPFSKVTVSQPGETPMWNRNEGQLPLSAARTNLPAALAVAASLFRGVREGHRALLIVEQGGPSNDEGVLRWLAAFERAGGHPALLTIGPDGCALGGKKPAKTGFLTPVLGGLRHPDTHCPEQALALLLSRIERGVAE